MLLTVAAAVRRLMKEARGGECRVVGGRSGGCSGNELGQLQGGVA